MTTEKYSIPYNDIVTDEMKLIFDEEGSLSSAVLVDSVMNEGKVVLKREGAEVVVKLLTEALARKPKLHILDFPLGSRVRNTKFGDGTVVWVGDVYREENICVLFDKEHGDLHSADRTGRKFPSRCWFFALKNSEPLDTLEMI